MIEELIKNHTDAITGMISKNYGVTNEQATVVTNTMLKSLSESIGAKAKNGQLNLSQLTDLFNKATPNQSNPIFKEISETISSALIKSGISTDIVSKISSGGLDEALKIIQSGKLGSIDSSAVSTMIAAISGKGGLNSLLGGLSNLFGKK